MSKIGKKENTGDTLEELKAKLAETEKEIKQTLGQKKSLDDIDPEKRPVLGTLYLKASLLSEKISQKSVDLTDVENYKNQAEKAKKLANKFGSIAKSKIPDTTFEDVKGLDEVKEIVKTFVFMTEHPEIMKYYKLHGGLGLLMYGAPGTGKTMFAEAMANKLNLPLFVVTPADIFKSYVGASEAAVRQIFEEIDACPDGAILFVDECESIFSKRTQDTKDYKSAVTTELLQRLNGFGVDGSKRILIGATNRPDIIDAAYLRYKRFSHKVHITPPDATAIRAILDSKIKGIQLEDGFTADEIMDMLEKATLVEKKPEDPNLSSCPEKCLWYSAADVCAIVEEACRLALEKIIEKHKEHPHGTPQVIPVTKEMFENSMKKIKPSIDEPTLNVYKNFTASKMFD